MKVKCYAIIEEEKITISEFANPSQKSFLGYELQEQFRKMLVGTDGSKIGTEKTSNGVWYRRVFNIDSDCT